MKNIIIAITLFLLFPIAASAGYESVTDTLETSVVTGTRLSTLRDALPVPVSVVTRARIEEQDQNALMPALMEQVPGLFVTSRGMTGYGVSNGAAGSISLRGLGASSGRVLILIDGHPQFESIYGHPVADEYISSNAHRVEVSRGASSVLYGSNAMGGAINIITRKPTRDGNKLDLRLMAGSYGTARANLSDNFKRGDLTLTANLNYDRTDGHRDNSAFHSVSGMAKAGYSFNDNWKLETGFNLMNAFSRNPGPSDAPVLDGFSDITRGMGIVSVSNDHGSTSGNVDLYYNWGRHLIDDGHTGSAPPQPFLFHATDFTAGMSAYQVFALFKGNSFTLGTDIMAYGGNAYRNPETEVYADHKRLNEEAVYFLDQQTLGRLSLSAGLRLDRHSLYGLELIPQAGVSYMPDRATTFKLSASKGFRMPNLRELYMYAVANEDLLPEEAWSYDFTAGRHFLDGALNMELSLFYTRGSNIIEVNVVEGVRQNRNVGEFANKGVEFSADYKAGPDLSFNMNYSFLHMDRIYAGVPENKLYAGVNWTPGRFSVNAGAMAIKGLYLSTGENPRTEDYVDVKIRAAYSVLDWLQIFGRLDNLLGVQYETMLNFPEPGRTFMSGVSMSF